LWTYTKMNTFAAVERANHLVAQMYNKVVQLEERLDSIQNNPNTVTQPIARDATLPSIAPKSIDAFTKTEVESKLRDLETTICKKISECAQTKVCTSTPMTSSPIDDKKMITELKKEIAKEKVLLETSLMHQINMAVNRMIDDKLASKIASVKDELVADVLEQIKHASPEMKEEQHRMSDDTFDIQFNVDDNSSIKKRGRKKATTVAGTV
jgi:hypothetical protein